MIHKCTAHQHILLPSYLHAISGSRRVPLDCRAAGPALGRLRLPRALAGKVIGAGAGQITQLLHTWESKAMYGLILHERMVAITIPRKVTQSSCEHHESRTGVRHALYRSSKVEMWLAGKVLGLARGRSLSSCKQETMDGSPIS